MKLRHERWFWVIVMPVILTGLSLIAHKGWDQHMFFVTLSWLGCLAMFGMKYNRWPGEKK